MAPMHMANAHWRLSLPALATFEAAARLLNFSKAARELGTTQPAVSQQIAALEAELRCGLFHRQHRGVSLTPEGAILFEAASLSRAAIERAHSDIGSRKGRHVVSIATDYGFAGDWLIPQLSALSSALPGVEVRIIASQSATKSSPKSADFAIRMGSGAWPGHKATLLFRETVFAVASPHYLARHPPVRAARDLAELRLLHLESEERAPWLNWSGWLAQHALVRPAREGDFFFNTYSMVQQAAIAGQGVALGWRPLIDGAISAGCLVPVTAAPVCTDMGYYLVEDTSRPRPAALGRFRAWLLEACAKAATEPGGRRC